ncbi:DNAJ heat shock N-terminal domain-containing protein [Abeliophyllum distichum]|uniref:DNAJ heat shock N-terminal domain-containing protein n=1 Tax=Abeliophyllum distichum TaxID=126358 RepID=A0ABD1VSC0_9LAMI
MECNRDEALRAKTIAEGKLEKKDFAGAKKLALKAHTLYPGLEGISQMLTTLDVYIAAENKISGEVDWYGVLGVNPSADDETIRKQYRKLALTLHPDKNKSVGADGAFKLLSEAWSLLSDKAKRLAYNQRRGSRGFHQKVQMHAGGPSAQSRANGYHNTGSRSTSVTKTQNNRARVPPTSVPTPSYQRTDTFWTICHRCKMHYEYLKIYLNHTLLCPNCHEAFMASETAPPFNFSKSSNTVSRHGHQNLNNHASARNLVEPGRNAAAAQKSGPGHAGPNLYGYRSYQQDPHSGTAGVGNTDPSAKAANVVQQSQEKMKRAYPEPPARWEGEIKKRKIDEYFGANTAYNMAMGSGGFGTVGASGSRIYGFSGANSKPNSTRDLTPLEIRNMLMEKSRKEILQKLKEWRLETADKVKEKAKEGKRNKHRSTGGHDQNGNGGLSAPMVADQANKCPVGHSADTADKGDTVAASMNVPDSDFHDFDQDRAESSFGDNEVWAGYDDDDGMPRFYALISKVISRNPFKVKISWLNSKTSSEFGPLDWVGSGFYKTCGEFRVGRYEICKSINSFSQKVNWSKGPRGTIQILPTKGDVWALYRNWAPDWNGQTPDEVIHKYDMVMVLDDYNEEQGVSVAPLVKVIGLKTVFRPNLDPQKVKRIPKEEMFQFSHRVPNHLLRGDEAENAPKGCLELDPAATPLELLQVITEASEVPTIPHGEDSKEEVLQSSPDTRLDNIANGATGAQEVEDDGK